MFSRPILTLYFFISVLATAFGNSDKGEAAKIMGRGFFTLLEERIERKVEDYTVYFTNWLEEINDKNLGKTALGRLLHYEDFKPKLEIGADTGATGPRMKKMGMAMLPLIFHMGVASTWMLVTAIMAAKSVAIGLALLVFKIAVTSAKLASFFTKMKKDDHHGWASWSPHHEHHGHKRGFSDDGQIEYHPHIEHQPHIELQSDYHPHEGYSAHADWAPTDYNTLPSPANAPEPYEHQYDERRKKTVV